MDMSGQDWEPVSFARGRGRGRGGAASGGARPAGAPAPGSGKFVAGTNKSSHFNAGGKSMRKLEETEETKHDRVDKNIARGIQKARLAKQMTQKELAHAIAEKATVVNQYESGKAIPNPAIINKLERALGTQLRERKKKKKRGGGAAR